MKSVRNRIILGIVALFVIGGIVAFFVVRANAQTPVDITANLQTTTASTGTISTSIVAAGTVRGQQTANLPWKTSGNVVAVDVKAGDIVTSGQELASLSADSVITSTADLPAAQTALANVLNSTTATAQALQKLQNAQDALDTYQSSFPSTQAAARSALTTAQNNLVKAQNQQAYITGGHASQAAIDTAQGNYNAALKTANHAQSVYDKTAGDPNTDTDKALALANLQDAQDAADTALAVLQGLQSGGTPIDISNAAAAVAQAQAALATAQQAWDAVKDGPNAAQLAILKAAVTDAQNSLTQVKNGPDPITVAAAQARVNADVSTINAQKIVAPFSGTITGVTTKLNDQVNDGDAAFRIDDLSKMLVDVTVAEIDIPKIQIGQPATLTFDAISGKTYQGSVTQVASVGTASSGVVNFGVTVEIQGADANVRSGMTAAVNIVTASKPNVLVVPSRAIHTTGGQHTVTVLLEGKLNTVPVTIGLANDTQSEITGGGLHEGDTIVIGNSTGAAATNRTGGGGIFGGLFRGAGR